jgi:hypothetical protein
MVVSILVPFLATLGSSVLISTRLFKNSQQPTQKASPTPIDRSVSLSLKVVTQETKKETSEVDGKSNQRFVSHLIVEENTRNASVFSNTANRSVLDLLRIRRVSYARARRRLFLLSTTFLLLNTPLVLSKMRYLYINSRRESARKCTFFFENAFHEKFLFRIQKLKNFSSFLHLSKTKF